MFPEREKDSIRNKFKALKNEKKPTGDPTIPVSVKRAKQIQRRIEDRISVETADDGVNHNEIGDDLDDDVAIQLAMDPSSQKIPPLLFSKVLLLASSILLQDHRLH